MLDDLGRQRIELNLFATALNQAVIDLCHPFGQGQFGTLVQEVGTVQLSVQLIHKIGAGQTKLVQKFAKSAASDMESIVPARH